MMMRPAVPAQVPVQTSLTGADDTARIMGRMPPLAEFGAPPHGGVAAHWLNLRRATAYPRIFVAIYLAATVVWVCLATDLVDPKGKPLGYDFITFWSASWLALAGESAAAFDAARIFAIQRIAVPASDVVFLWHYPPTFHLIVLPLALMPYFAAYGVWLAGTFAGYAWVIRRFAPARQTIFLLLAFPGTFINAFHGQNGFLTTALFGGAILALPTRPALAGVLFGLLSFKPQLGLLIPLALACGRRWTSFVVAAATTAAFAAISALVLGAGPWLAFWNNLPLVRMVLDDGGVPWAKIPSLYIFLRTLGMAATAAYVLHAVLALVVAALVARAWWRGTNPLLAAAVLTSGAVLVPPYLFDYDLALLAIPVAIIAWDGVQRGWLPWEREVLLAAWLLPLVAPGFTEATGVPVATPCLVALMAIAVRRAAQDQALSRAPPDLTRN